MTLAVSGCMVVPMVIIMSLYGAFEGAFHAGTLAIVPMAWIANIPWNFVMALPWNLLVAGPFARFVFRLAFPMGTVLEEPVELTDLGAIGGEDEADDFAVEAV